MPTAVTHKAIVEQINAGFAENNLEKVLSFCTDNLVWMMVGGTTVRGKDAIRKWMASMNPQPPKFTIRQVVEEGDAVTTRGDMTMAEAEGEPYIPTHSVTSIASREQSGRADGVRPSDRQDRRSPELTAAIRYFNARSGSRRSSAPSFSAVRM